MKQLFALVLLLPSLAAGQSMLAKDWFQRGSEGVALMAQSDKGPGWYFDFPGSNGHVNYVITRYGIPLAGSVSMTLRVTASADVEWQYGAGAASRGPIPASVRFYFENVDLVCEFCRWWSHSVSYRLAQGAVTLTVPLDASQWSSVFGKRADQDDVTRAAFADAKSKVGAVGMTFGGGYAYGHGVWLSRGSARFTLTDFRVGP